MYQATISTIIIIAFCIGAGAAYAQNPSDLYMFSVERTGKGEYHLHNAKFLSSFNKGGYTNQPSFTPSGDILVSVRKKGENQNDILQLMPALKKYKRLTKTNASEYSPRIHPDEEQLTVLRQLSASPLDQQVCNIPLRSGEMECVTVDIKDVGYYTWLNPKELGLFRIDGTTGRLAYYNVDENKSRRISTAIGRTLMTDKTGQLVYVHKFADDFWYIKKYNPSNSAIEIVNRTIAKNEDFALASDGTYFMAKDNILYTFHPDRGKDWVQLADLSAYGIRYITRMAISPDLKKLVIVAEQQKS